VKLLVGLGNPGSGYTQTRHNIGFMILDEVARRSAVSFRNRFHSEYGEAALSGSRLLLLKPQTYMNLSGSAVMEAMRFYKIPMEDLLVIHDDVDLDFGTMKIRSGGSDGGHKGIRSILEHLSSPDFVRVRVGVGRPRYGEDTADFVLRGFYPDEAVNLARWIEKGADAAAAIIRDGWQKAANRYNRKRFFQPESEENPEKKT